ncbi:HK97 family phage prohead protease [Marinifilum flexuosum]|uniref:HK97 family phage prohead protease n=1 Tax=Marinifilum flexuosum TaxID=1117708 RepID=UPI002494457B|nr:HK97 family phage prohead protease [Marinifilum flexuosum]
MSNVETRSCDIKIKEEENKNPRIVGYAAKYNQPSELLVGYKNGKTIRFYEYILPGAFGDCLETSDPRAYWNHDTNEVLARKSNGTLDLWLDETGLGYSFELAPHFRGDYLKYHIEKGDIRESSFGFVVESDRWEIVDGVYRRYIEKISKLTDVSPVSVPAYPNTEASLRNLGLSEEFVEKDSIGEKKSVRSSETVEAEDIYRRQIFLNHKINLIKIK